MRAITLAESAKADLKKRKVTEARGRNSELRSKLAKLSGSSQPSQGSDDQASPAAAATEVSGGSTTPAHKPPPPSASVAKTAPAMAPPPPVLRRMQAGDLPSVSDDSSGASALDLQLY